MSLTASSILQGHQERVVIDGRSTLTLKELWTDLPRAMIIGLNPAPVSVRAGDYYQGKAGKSQMGRLAGAGFFGEMAAGVELDDAALAQGIGFADLVRRPTPGERDVGPEEINAGRRRLSAALLRYQVPFVISVFRHPALMLIGLPKKLARPGLLPGSDQLPGIRVFRMPGPYAGAALRDSAMAELKELLAGGR